MFCNTKTISLLFYLVEFSVVASFSCWWETQPQQLPCLVSAALWRESHCWRERDVVNVVIVCWLADSSSDLVVKGARACSGLDAIGTGASFSSIFFLCSILGEESVNVAGFFVVGFTANCQQLLKMCEWLLRIFYEIHGHSAIFQLILTFALHSTSLALF